MDLDKQINKMNKYPEGCYYSFKLLICFKSVSETDWLNFPTFTAGDTSDTVICLYVDCLSFFSFSFYFFLYICTSCTIAIIITMLYFIASGGPLDRPPPTGALQNLETGSKATYVFYKVDHPSFVNLISGFSMLSCYVNSPNEDTHFCGNPPE